MIDIYGEIKAIENNEIDPENNPLKMHLTLLKIFFLNGIGPTQESRLVTQQVQTGWISIGQRSVGLIMFLEIET